MGAPATTRGGPATRKTPPAKKKAQPAKKKKPATTTATTAAKKVKGKPTTKRPTTTRKQIQALSIDGFAVAFDHVPPPFFLQAKKNGDQVIFMRCEERKGNCNGVPTSHRCMVKLTKG